MNLILAIIAAAAMVLAQQDPEPIALNVAVPPGGFVAPSDPCLRRRSSQQIMPEEAEMNGFQPNPYARDGCCDNVVRGYGGGRCIL